MNKLLSTIIVVTAITSSVTVTAQEKKTYTNFQDTVFNINEVEIIAQQKKDINVTKLAVPAAYLPITTNTLPSQVLVNRGIQNIQDAVRFLPGVRYQTSYGAFQQLSIRGFDHSIVMVDGIRDERSSIDNSYPFMDLSSIQSIELLKGPASVLYGQSAVGGVLNIVRKAPSSKQKVDASVSYGSYYNVLTTIDFGGKLIGPLNYLANFHYQNNDGWRDNATKRLSGYLAIGGKLTNADEVDFRVAGNHDYYSTEIGLPDIMTADIYKVSDNSKYLNKGDLLPGLDREKRYNSESDFMYNRSFNTSAQWKHNFSEAAKLTEKVSYAYDDIDYFGTEGLSYLTSSKPVYDYYYTSGTKKTYICLDSLYYDFPLRFSHIAHTYNNQIEMNGKFQTGNIKHNYMGGYSFIALIRDSYSGYKLGVDVTGPGLTGHGSVYHPHSIGWMDTKFSKVTVQRTYMHGFYLQDLVEFNEKLKALFAGRYDLYRFKRASGVPTIDGARKYDDPDEESFNIVKTSAFTGRVGVVYLPVKTWSIYGSFGTYFKPNRTFFNENTRYIDKNGNEFYPKGGEEVFKPEKGSQLEIGTRYDVTNKIQATASVFFINKYNITRTLASKGDVINGETLDKNVIGQVGRMDSRGFDLDITYRPINGLSLSTGYAYTDAQIREMADNSFMSSDATKGRQFQYIPKNTFYVYGDYVVTEGFLKNFGINFDVTYQDKVYRNSTNTTAFDSYWLTDAGISYKLKNNIGLRLNINNLFDKEYFNQALGNQYVPSMPRNFLATITYSL